MLNFIESINSRVFLVILTLLSVIFSIIQINELSISYNEAYTYFYANNLLHYLTNFSANIFSQTDLGIKAIFIFFNILNIILLYKVSKYYLRKENDVNLLLLLYVLTPATISASIIINEAIITIFCTLLFLYLYQKKEIYSFFLLPIFLFIDNSFFIFYFALFFMHYQSKIIN